MGFSSAMVGAADWSNFLLITVDDMSAEVVGIYGSLVPGVTPNIDQLGREGLRFERAHVQVANSMAYNENSPGQRRLMRVVETPPISIYFQFLVRWQVGITFSNEKNQYA